MARAGQGTKLEIPYAELVIRPADTRPIVITLQEMGGQVEFSQGPSSDLVEAYVVLALMAAAGRSIGVVRILKEENHPGQIPLPGGGDDIPF